MLSAIEHILNAYQGSATAKLYRLTRDEFIYFYLIAEGHTHFQIMDYFGCQKDKLYRLRLRIIRKMKATNLHHGYNCISGSKMS